MSGTERPVSEDDLHAYVDNLLDEARLPVVQRYLREHKQEAARVAAYRAQREALRAGLAAQAGASIPAHLSPRVILLRRRSERRLMWRAAAAVVLAFGLGGGGGWFLHWAVTPPPTDLNVLVREAVANHIVYTADRRRPTELGPDQKDDLARWVSNRLNHKVAPPDLTDSG
ncbi:MAG: anti-sigma factor, partial [Acetobacteraceae bacterium]